jgi:O-antigen/teichoic acid export membrane protein
VSNYVALKHLNMRRNAIFAMCEFAINMALVFFGYRLLIHQGGLEAVGVWATMYAWTNIIRLGDAGFAGAAARFVALFDVDKEPHRVRTYGETALLTNVAQFALLAVIGYFVLSPATSRLVGAAHAREAEQILPLMLAGFFLLNVSGTVLGILQGLHRGYQRSQLSVVGTCIQLAAVFAFVPKHGLAGLAIAQIVQHSVVSIVGWSLVRRQIGSGWVPSTIDGTAFRTMLGYSVKAQVANVANGLVEPLAKILVGHFGGMSTQGIFELAYKTVLLPRNLIGSGVTATSPTMTRLFEHDRPQLRQLYRRAFRLSVGAMAAAALGLVVFAPLSSALWVGHVDRTFCMYVAFLATGFLGNALGIPAYVLAMAAGHIHQNIVITVTTLISLAMFGFVLGSVFGGDGAAAANGIAIGLAGVFSMLLNGRLVRGNDQVAEV